MRISTLPFSSFALSSLFVSSFALSTLVLFACGSDDAPSDTATAASTTGTSNGGTGDDGGTGGSGGDTGGGGGGGGGAGRGGSGGDPVGACADIGAAECFSSHDCPAPETRCENVGTERVATPCCVEGARGAGVVGDPCTGEADCASALCIVDEDLSLCTDICVSADDCPPSLPECVVIAFSGSDDSFCVP